MALVVSALGAAALLLLDAMLSASGGFYDYVEGPDLDPRLLTVPAGVGLVAAGVATYGLVARSRVAARVGATAQRLAAVFLGVILGTQADPLIWAVVLVALVVLLDLTIVLLAGRLRRPATASAAH